MNEDDLSHYRPWVRTFLRNKYFWWIPIPIIYVVRFLEIFLAEPFRSRTWAHARYTVAELKRDRELVKKE